MFVSIAIAKFIYYYKLCGKGAEKYAQFYKSWLHYMRTISTPNDPENPVMRYGIVSLAATLVLYQPTPILSYYVMQSRKHESTKVQNPWHIDFLE